jgi:hypothetical protein
MPLIMYDLWNYFIVVNRVYLFKEITRNLYSWNSFKARNLGKGLFGGTLSQQDFVINESQNANALPPKRLQFS